MRSDSSPPPLSAHFFFSNNQNMLSFLRSTGKLVLLLSKCQECVTAISSTFSLFLLLVKCPYIWVTHRKPAAVFLLLASVASTVTSFQITQNGKEGEARGELLPHMFFKLLDGLFLLVYSLEIFSSACCPPFSFIGLGAVHFSLTLSPTHKKKKRKSRACQSRLNYF